MKELEKQSSTIDLIQLAIEKNADVEKIERLYALHQQWEKKQSEKFFFEDFSLWLGNQPEIKKNKKVTYTNKANQKTEYNYAPLSEIKKAIDPVLSKYGFSYRWEQHEENNKITITCILSHKEGHSEQTSISGYMDESGGKNAIQQTGSTVSYLQRYTLCSITGVTAEDDIDGHNTPETIPPPPARPTPPPPAKPTPAKPKEVPALSKERFNKAVEKINIGELEKDVVLNGKGYTLTEEQKQIINNL